MTYTPEHIERCRRIAVSGILGEWEYRFGDFIAYGHEPGYPSFTRFVDGGFKIPYDAIPIGGDRLTNKLVEWLNRHCAAHELCWSYKSIIEPAAKNGEMWLFLIEWRGEIVHEFEGDFTSTLIQAVDALLQQEHTDAGNK